MHTLMIAYVWGYAIERLPHPDVTERMDALSGNPNVVVMAHYRDIDGQLIQAYHNPAHFPKGR